MSDDQHVVRIAAKGDGVTRSGRHVAGAVPGDRVAADGSLVQGPHHVSPPCQHFARCGACQLQHADEDTLCAFVRDRVVNAARGQGVEPQDVLGVHLSPPFSRRRATLHGLSTKAGAVLGFREGGSHAIVDVRQCLVLDPQLFALTAPTRDFIARYGGRGAIEVSLTASDQGVDMSLTNVALEGLVATEAAIAFARSHDLARLTVHDEYAPQVLWEPEPATVTLSNVAVPLPAQAFLQATVDAERRMVADAAQWLDGAALIADLFAGLGTFAFALADAPGRHVLAVEADRAAHDACRSVTPRARGTIETAHRDLFRSPLTAKELDGFDAVLLDPPRAGARAQIDQIAVSNVAQIIYVSCNPASWARDAATLAQAGYALKKLRPIGQFRWSTHVELTSLFERL